MAIYAIGDVHGCYRSLCLLLEKIAFKPPHDFLWLTGDLVGRGPDPLSVLRLLQQLAPVSRIVLGNHDLHLLACALGLRENRDSGIAALLQAPDCDVLLDWLRQQPIFHDDPQQGYALVHAGLHPQWDMGQARALSSAISAALCSEDRGYALLKAVFSASRKEDSTDEMLRLAEALQYFTTMRFLSPEGRLSNAYKGSAKNTPPAVVPWFCYPRKPLGRRLLFGHWAALGYSKWGPFYCLDSGCVWGGCLSALRLGKKPQYYFVACDSGEATRRSNLRNKIPCSPQQSC